MKNFLLRLFCYALTTGWVAVWWIGNKMEAGTNLLHTIWRHNLSPGRPPLDILRRETITRADSRPYLFRFSLFRCFWFGAMLHRFDGPDDDCLHDHPFPFISIILRGGYWETHGDGWYTSMGGDKWLQMPRRWHGPGSVLFRPAHWAHRIEPGRPGKTWTLVLHGPRMRAWGFFTRFGWVPWRKYSHAEHCS